MSEREATGETSKGLGLMMRERQAGKEERTEQHMVEIDDVTVAFRSKD